MNLFTQIQSLQPADIAKFCVTFLVSYIVCTATLKSLLLRVLRIFGLHSPEIYSFLPSAVPLPNWRSLYRIRMQLSRWFEVITKFGKHSTGGFANALSTMTMLYRSDKVLLGRIWWAGFGLLQPVGISIQRHLMVYAMSGAGKTTWLITMLSLWRGSAWLVDPKGQVTYALMRLDWRTWIVLNPYSPKETAQWNPVNDVKFAMEREGNHTAVKWTIRLAQCLVITPAQSKSPFFTDTARSQLVSLILHVLSAHPEEHHNLPFIRHLIVHGYRVFNDDGSLESTPEEARALLDKALLENEAFGGAVAAQAAAYINATGDTKSSLVATLQEQTKWLDLPTVAHMLMNTTRPLSEAKTRDDVVFSFVVPVMSLREEIQPLLRAYTNFTTYTFEAVKEKKGQCLCIVDEVQAMGHNPTLEVALPVARSYGQSIVAIAQDREGMKASYPKTYGSFEGNADCVLCMASNHQDNLDYIAKALGKTTHIDTDPKTGRKSHREVDVMTAEQVKRFLSPETCNLIALRAGGRALRLKIAPYFHELPVTRYMPDPDHCEPVFKRLSRFVLSPLILWRKAQAMKRQKRDMNSNQSINQTNEGETS